MLKTFYFTFKGVYISGSGVVIDVSKDKAHKLINSKLKEQGFEEISIDEVIEVKKYDATIIDNGDY